jgi:CHAT domain
VMLKVLIGESALHASVQQEIRDGLTQTEIGSIEQTPAQLTQSIRAWSPNILHFFCHGQADTGGQSLELATANDHLQRAANNLDVVSGSVRVTTQNLVRLGGSLDNPWLLVLNCCSSGKAGVGLQSMANQAVSTGFPAVVAMMEPVDANDAYEFTRAFYPEAFAALRQASDELQHRASTSLEWTSILYHARTAISQLNNRDVQACAEWSLPVLYVRGLDAHIFIRPLTQDGAHSQQQMEKFRRQAEMAAMWLRTAGQQMSETERLQVMGDVLAAVPKELWPSLDGRFDHDDRI